MNNRLMRSLCTKSTTRLLKSCRTSSEHINKKDAEKIERNAEKIERNAEGCLTSQVDETSSSKD